MSLASCRSAAVNILPLLCSVGHCTGAPVPGRGSPPPCKTSEAVLDISSCTELMLFLQSLPFLKFSGFSLLFRMQRSWLFERFRYFQQAVLSSARKTDVLHAFEIFEASVPAVFPFPEPIPQEIPPRPEPIPLGPGPGMRPRRSPRCRRRSIQSRAASSSARSSPTPGGGN